MSFADSSYSNAPKQTFTSIQFSASSIGSYNEDFEASEETDLWNTFGDEECGEPMNAQHLVLDFTPDENDNSEIEKQCNEFWKLYNSHPELQQMTAKPDPCYADYASSTSDKRHGKESKVNLKQEKSNEINKTAVSVLEICERDELLTGALETKMYASMCTLGSREYPILEEFHSNKAKILASAKPLPVFKLQKRKLSSKASMSSTRSSSDIIGLCNKLVDWDKVNPKSFDPPQRLNYDLN